MICNSIMDEGGSFKFNANWERINQMDIDNYSKIAMFDIRNYLSQDLLYKMDIASMANSLEVRLPFLDYEFVEWAINVPTKFKVNGTQKYLPKKYLEKSLTHQSIYRKKWGFPAPVNKWFKGDLKEQINTLLKTDVGLNQKFVQQLCNPTCNQAMIYIVKKYLLWRNL